MTTTRRRETRWGRTLGWWGASLMIVIVFVCYPTEFKWSRWLYGLIWGVLTSGVIYLFRGFFEKDVEEPQWSRRNKPSEGTK